MILKSEAPSGRCLGWGLRKGETCMRQGRSRCEGGWSALHSLLQPPNTHCGGPVCPLGLVPLALTVGMEVWQFPFPAHSRARGAENPQ